MKKFKFILPLSLGVFLFGCENNNSLVEYEEPPFRHELAENDSEGVQENYIFSLNEEEVEIYELLKSNLSTSVLKDVSPFSIARIHIQARIDGELEVEYIMFSDVGREKTLEEWIVLHEMENNQIINNKDYLITKANENYSLLGKGMFIEDTENHGRIVFRNIFGDSMSFKLIKNDDSIWEVAFNPIEKYTFKLSEEEIQIYSNLKDTLSTSVLKNVSPFSIAKIHIQAGIDGEWEVEHAMFSQLGLERTLEEWIEYIENERAQIEDISGNFEEHIRVIANETFALLEKGDFIEYSETEAHIIFKNIFGDPMSFRFIKNQYGIWEVSYSPLQFV